MGGIKLQIDNEYVIIYKINQYYQITSIFDWISLCEFTHGWIIIDHPNGSIQVPATRKFIYNQSFQITKNLDFEYCPIEPLGVIDPFTGSIDGLNHTMSNINIICPRKIIGMSEMPATIGLGLIDKIYLGIIKNLIIKNICIIDSDKLLTENQVFVSGSLISEGYNCTLTNIKIIGTVYIKANNVCCLSNYFTGIANDITICAGGQLIGSSLISIVSNNYKGELDLLKIYNRFEQNHELINKITGKIINSNINSIHTFDSIYNLPGFDQLDLLDPFNQYNLDKLIQQINNYDLVTDCMIQNAKQIIKKLKQELFN
jgi:hypothetical protein